jgi:hypothetical protein
MQAVCLLDDSFDHCNDVFDGGGATFVNDHGDHDLCDHPLHPDLACNDLAGVICNKDAVHGDNSFNCIYNKFDFPMVLSEALYSTSDFKHLQFCNVTNCKSCVPSKKFTVFHTCFLS